MDFKIRVVNVDGRRLKLSKHSTTTTRFWLISRARYRVTNTHCSDMGYVTEGL